MKHPPLPDGWSYTDVIARFKCKVTQRKKEAEAKEAKSKDPKAKESKDKKGKVKNSKAKALTKKTSNRKPSQSVENSFVATVLQKLQI